MLYVQEPVYRFLSFSWFCRVTNDIYRRPALHTVPEGAPQSYLARTFIFFHMLFPIKCTEDFKPSSISTHWPWVGSLPLQRQNKVETGCNIKAANPASCGEELRQAERCWPMLHWEELGRSTSKATSESEVTGRDRRKYTRHLASTTAGHCLPLDCSP